MYHRWIYPLRVFRACCTSPFVSAIRMLRAARWEMALTMALFLSVWTTVLLLPNPMMPSSAAHTHLA